MTETVTEFTSRKGKGCANCGLSGEVLFFIDRPGGPPGNQRMPCPECYKDQPCSSETQAALDDLKNFEGK